MKALTFLLLFFPLFCFAQPGEGRLGNITENEAHGYAGMIATAILYEATRSKNTFGKSQYEYTRQEIKHFFRTLTLTGVGAVSFEGIDYLKGGDFSVQDAGATFAGGLFVAIIECFGRMFLHDRYLWRKAGLRLKIGGGGPWQ